MKNELVLLPPEVQELSLKVSEEKQQEVQTVLTQIFQGTTDWEKQVDAIEVKDINDSMSIQMADAARKNAKTARLSAEKIFDSKRSEVQDRMQDDKLEDALWLKSKQIMQIKFKSIEEKAEFKADFVKRYNQEQKELKTQLRLEKISKFNPEVNRIEIENLSDEMFETVFNGLQKEYDDKIAAEKQVELDRIEAERILELSRLRRYQLMPLWDYVNEPDKELDFGLIGEKDFDKIYRQAESDKQHYINEQEKIRLENERLQKEAEAKEKQRLVEIENDRKEHEANMKAAHEEREKAIKEETMKREKLQAENEKKLEADRIKHEKEAELKEKARLEELEKIRKIEAEKQKEHEVQLKKEREEREKEAELGAIAQAKLNAENQAKEKQLQALKDAEQKEKQRLLDIELTKKKAEKAATLAPDKDKLIDLSKRIMSVEMPVLKSKETNDIMLNVIDLLSKIDSYITEKVKTL